MVILLVVKRKVLGSLCNGSDVISVRKDICSTVSHVRANFPGADASLIYLSHMASVLGRRGSERFCWRS